MEKMFKLVSNSMLTVFLLGIMILPIASMTVMGIKPADKNEVLSAQDDQTAKETTESVDTESVDLEEIDNR
ncbi:hypothetical protein HGB13_05190 [bacterium]|nr:hypothetical protein [bacterium]